MGNPWHRLRPLPAAPLLVRRRYLTEVPSPLPAAPLVVRRRYLIVVLWPLRRCASRVLNRGAQADAHSATQVLDRGGQAIARGSCLSQVIRQCCSVLLAKKARSKQGECKALVVKGHVSNPWHRLRPLPAAPLVVRRRCLIEVLSLLNAAPLVCAPRLLN